MKSLTEDKVLDSFLSEIVPSDVREGEFLNSLNWRFIDQQSSNCKIPKPLLYHLLKKTQLIEKLPESLRLYLKEFYLLNFTRNTFFLEAFMKIQTLFAVENIEIIPLKGMALLFSVYKDIGLRPMDDIDLLIKKKDVLKAQKLLLASGYQEHELPFNYSKTIGNRAVQLDMHQDLWYLKAMGRFKSNIYGIDQIWKDIQRFYLDDGSSAQIMAVEDLLINVAAHAAVDHVRPRPLWLYDITSICDTYKEKMQWDSFLDKVVAYNLRVTFYQLFKLVRENFNGTIPQFIIDELKPGKNNFFEVRLHDWSLNNSSLTWLGHLLRIFTSSHLSGKIRLILFYFFPDKAFMIERYKIKNERFIYFYYPLRVIIFIQKIIKIFMGFLKGKNNNRITR